MCVFEHGNESGPMITEQYVRNTLSVEPVCSESSSQHPVRLVQVNTDSQHRSAYVTTVLSHKPVIVSTCSVVWKQHTTGFIWTLHIENYHSCMILSFCTKGHKHMLC